MSRKLLLIPVMLFIIVPLTMAQNICNRSGDLLIFSNFEGGILNIVMDEDIADVKIGINSYYNMDVRISGPFAKNVVAVHCISTGKKGECNGGVPRTTVSGVPGFTKIEISTEKYFAPCGGFEGGTACNDGYLDPAYSDLTSYFESAAFSGAKLFSYKQQFECWTKEIRVSEGGNCCSSDLQTITAKAGKDKVICKGQKVLVGEADFNCNRITQEWTPVTGLQTTSGGMVYASPAVTTTYTLTMTNNGVKSTDQVIVRVKGVPKVPVLLSNSPVCIGGELILSVKPNPGESYIWEGPDRYYASDETIHLMDVTKKAAGNYKVHADFSGCETTTATIKVVVKPCAEIAKAEPKKNTVSGSGYVPGAATTKKMKPVAEPKPVVVREPVAVTTPVEPKKTAPAPKPAAKNKKYQFLNSKKNGVFVVSGFQQAINQYDSFEVFNEEGEPVNCKRLKFGDKLIVDISDKEPGKYTLVITLNGVPENVEFVLGPS